MTNPLDGVRGLIEEARKPETWMEKWLRLGREKDWGARLAMLRAPVGKG